MKQFKPNPEYVYSEERFIGGHECCNPSCSTGGRCSPSPYCSSICELLHLLAMANKEIEKLNG